MVSMGNAPDQLLPSDYVGLYNSILCQFLPSAQYALPIDFTYRPQAPTELVPMRTGRCQFSLLFFGPDFALCLNKPSSKEYKSLFFAPRPLEWHCLLAVVPISLLLVVQHSSFLRIVVTEE